MIRTRPYLHVVLHQPEIPANAGNIARLCGAAELRLHLIHPLGFKVDDKHLKRAGLDYWSEIDVCHHASFEAFLESKEEGDADRLQQPCVSRVSDGEGPARGLSALRQRDGRSSAQFVKEAYPCYRIPIWGKVRSLNLSTAAGIVVYHYLHKMGRF